MEVHNDPLEEPQRIIDLPTPNRRPLWQKILFLVVLVTILALIVFGLSFLINRNSDEATQKSTDSTEQNQATTSAQGSSEQCSPKQDLANSKQGYLACFETSWKQKELKPSGLEVGLAATDISGNFPGTINVSVTDKSEELVTQDLSNNSSKFEFGKVNVDNIKSTQLVLTRQRDDPLIAYPRAIVTATEKNDRTYVFTLNSTDASIETDTKLYEDFLATVEFSDNASSPPWSESRNVMVYQPWPGDSISSPVIISGEALSVEAVVNVRVKDKSGKTLTETTIKSASGTERSAFSGNVTFDKGRATEGTIEVYTNSSSDGSEQDKVTISVKFQ